MRIATGGSEGGICAFALSWFRPDLFGKVLSWVGAFVNIRGGHHLPWLVRNTPRQSIVVWLADGVNDSNSQHGSLPLANEQMAAALEYSGYTYRIEWGQGGHSPKHQASLLPEALRWLFAHQQLLQCSHPGQQWSPASSSRANGGRGGQTRVSHLCIDSSTNNTFYEN